MSEDLYGISRRRALQVLGGAGMAALAGCTSLAESVPGDDSGLAGDPTDVTPRAPPSDPADETFTLTAAPGTDASEVPQSTWLYDDTLPGPEIRASEGDVVGVSLTNELPDETSVHWHGLPVANGMDGVPNLTQDPVEPGDSFEYRFRADPPGTYFYHSHAGLQLDRGLAGPLVVEEDEPHVDYDDEYVIVLDDYLPDAPRSPSESDGTSGGGMGGGGPMGGMGGGGPMGGMMNDYRPPYAGMTMNGRGPSNAPRFGVSDGDRIRLRFVNAASATTFRVRAGGHAFEISHADGRPVEPVSADSFTFGPGERYDAIVTANNPGTWAIDAIPVRGSKPGARGVLQYDSANDDRAPTAPETGGRTLQYGDLRSIESIDGIDGTPDRTFDLTLSPGGDGYSWAISGQVFPDADPLDIREGDHVRIHMRNQSPVPHPMHLHGHFFSVGNAIKDTVVVPGHMGETTIDFKADNPGNWFFHCHNLYHLEAGMARVIRYV